MEWDNPNDVGSFTLGGGLTQQQGMNNFQGTWGNTAGGFGLSNYGSLISGGLQGLSGLANAYMGYKNYGLAKKQFGFQKALANRNIANQGKIINTAYDNAAQVAAGMIGSKDATTGSFGFTNQSIVDQYAAKAKEKYVDTSPIK